MKHLKPINENFFKRAANAVGKMISPDPISVDPLDDTEKKYTEKQLFDLTDEAFRLGYTVNSDGGSPGLDHAKRIGNNSIMNYHKEWWNDMMKKFSLLKSR